MATSLHYVIQNYYWKIEAITPTVSEKKFYRVDPLNVEELGDSSGAIRRFWVEWLGSGEDLGTTNFSSRDATHRFAVNVVYPTSYGTHLQLQQLIVRDRHDLIYTLRDSNLVGYSDAQSSTSIGLNSRWRTGDELQTGEPDLWILRMEFDCHVTEIEQAA